ncbi:hypothetical protein BKA93DRAFT_345585 [Sparassis latifolia]
MMARCLAGLYMPGIPIIEHSPPPSGPCFPRTIAPYGPVHASSVGHPIAHSCFPRPYFCSFSCPARIAGLAMSVISRTSVIVYWFTNVMAHPSPLYISGLPEASPGLDSRTALLHVVIFEAIACPTVSDKDTVSRIFWRLYLLHHRCTHVLRGWTKVAHRSHTQGISFTSLNVRYSPSILRVYVSDQMFPHAIFPERRMFAGPSTVH